ncbi:MAG: L,D-transpeptidase [Rubrivivax sp.]|nr:L,D-transpeptidase [Rubrivivax sp.]
MNKNLFSRQPAGPPFSGCLQAFHAGCTALALALAAAPAAAVTSAARLPPALTELAQALEPGDTGGRPYAIVDKLAATIAVFHADGRLAGVAPVLLGRSAGDHTVAGVGERTQSGTLREGDRTTPAGRFITQPGLNSSGEAVIWVDYASALAIHRLRPGAGLAERTRRLASSRLAERRVSAGCVVVPVAFFDSVVQPTLGIGAAVVYLMPERGPWQAVWPQLARTALP